MTVLILLTTAGAGTGPFNLLSNVDGFTTPFETGVAKSALTTPPGYTSALVPNGTTIIRVRSTGACTNSIDIIIGATPPTTTTTTTVVSPTTTTTTTGIVVCKEYFIANQDFIECIGYSYTACDGTPVSGSLCQNQAITVCARQGTVVFGSTILEGANC